ncbi:Histidine phosphatase superfamily, clade-2 [Kalmanozyma brasiliensis GHG001]|uniref:3-phytase A n=1 Tax=Kalmanozyma brasiliensis (strain GHG001) TaxID=1365824 RepID=V5F1U5_KALBG|nr:Histidine phosphatase superfamily, clade-2 [Kalmanozyma brasiliensis GHG001]EST09309.1 Histidine phosphatase superfamily, clade-2 [Kalmanozyma brasiliensis GHG001]
MPAPSKKDRRSEDSDLEAESLILHRLSTDASGTSRIQSVGGTSTTPRVTDAYDDLDEDYEIKDKREKLPARGVLEDSNGSTRIDKTGRPAWLRGVLEGDVPGMRGRGAGMSASMAQRNRKQRARCMKLSMLVGGGLLVIGAFAFALGPKVGVSPHAIYDYMGDKWYGDSGVMPFEFNKPVGYPGFYTTGVPPDFAEHMTRTATAPTQTVGSSPMQTTIPGFQDASFKPFEHMGPLTPYISSSGWGVDDAKYAGTPTTSSGKTCQLTQAHMLHRHGARYPTAHGPPDVLRDFLRQNPNLRYSGSLSFLNSYKFGVGEELLTPVGRGQLYDSGVKAALLYGKLVADDLAETDANKKPKTLFARAGSQQRIVDSGLAWLNGFFGANWTDSTSFEIQIEEPGFNTTTAPEFACPAWRKPENNPGGAMADKWAAAYLQDAVFRLGPNFGGAALNSTLLFAMQQMCSYDTVAFGYSDFCGLFTKQEWLDYEYAWDLKFMNGNGATSPLGRGYGLGWVNEFVSRLTSKPWDPAVQTSENSTLDLDATTFPLDRRFYVDFTHDSTITSVLAALDLPDFDDTFAVPDAGKGVDAKRHFITSKAVPFAARFVVEVWNCGEEWVRFKLNDAVVPLGQYKDCEKRADGLCKKESLLKALSGRNSKGWWDKCRV